jgi:hypothetical protein
MGVPTKIGVFFLSFEVTYPPIFKGSEANGVIKNFIIYHHLKDMGGMKFQGGRIDEGMKGSLSKNLKVSR